MSASWPELARNQVDSQLTEQADNADQTLHKSFNKFLKAEELPEKDP